MVQGEINRGRHTDHPARRHSIRTNQCPPPPSSHVFYRPDALPAAQPRVSKHWRCLDPTKLFEYSEHVQLSIFNRQQSVLSRRELNSQFHITSPTRRNSVGLNRGATTFSKLGVQCLGVGYCTEQNADGIPSFVHCRLLRNGNHTLHQKKLGWSVQFFFLGGGPDPSPDTSLSGCALGTQSAFSPFEVDDGNVSIIQSTKVRLALCRVYITWLPGVRQQNGKTTRRA